MRFIEVLETTGRAAKCVGKGTAWLFSQVSPDIWRELGYISLTSYSLLLPRREEVKDHGPDGFAPVVLVHGLGGNRGCWTPLRLFLRMNGRRRIYAYGYSGGTVEEIADGLKRFVDEVLAATGESSVEIVAHSLGGVVSRYAIQRLGMADSVRSLITMATPHQGTYAARWANTTLTRPLCPDSALMKDLATDDLSLLPMKFVSIYSDRDVYVVPASMMTHPAAENILLPGLSHSQHLASTAVFRVVQSKLSPMDPAWGEAGATVPVQ